MSKKSSRPGAKVSLPQPPPRALPEIEAAYGQLATQAGQIQYQIHVFKKDLERLNDNMVSLNYEAAARKELDTKAAAKQEVKSDV